MLKKKKRKWNCHIVETHSSHLWLPERKKPLKIKTRVKHRPFSEIFLKLSPAFTFYSQLLNLLWLTSITSTSTSAEIQIFASLSLPQRLKMGRHCFCPAGLSPSRKHSALVQICTFPKNVQLLLETRNKRGKNRQKRLRPSKHKLHFIFSQNVISHSVFLSR